MRLLLKCGAQVDSELSNAYTPLHIASKYGYLDLVKEFICHGAYLAKFASDSKGRCVQPIHMAAENNHLEVVQTLIEAGADINATREYLSRNGVTALHLAVVKNYLDTVRLLVDMGASVDCQDDEGTTPLHLVARGGFKEMADLLLKGGAIKDVGSSSKQSHNQTPLHFSVRFKNYEVAQLLIEAGCDINATEKMVISPAHTKTSLFSQGLCSINKLIFCINFFEVIVIVIVCSS